MLTIEHTHDIKRIDIVLYFFSLIFLIFSSLSPIFFKLFVVSGPSKRTTFLIFSSSSSVRPATLAQRQWFLGNELQCPSSHLEPFRASQRFSFSFLLLLTGLRRMDMVERKLSVVVNPVVPIFFTDGITAADSHISFRSIISPR